MVLHVLEIFRHSWGSQTNSHTIYALLAVHLSDCELDLVLILQYFLFINHPRFFHFLVKIFSITRSLKLVIRMCFCSPWFFHVILEGTDRFLIVLLQLYEVNAFYLIDCG